MQLNKSKIEHQAAIRIGERYWMATLLLMVIIIACIGIIVHRQTEVNNCWISHRESRSKIESLIELKGHVQERNNYFTHLASEKDKLAAKYNLCTEKLTACEGTKKS